MGITSDISRRWGNNGAEYLRKNSPLSSAIKKYGWDGFDHDILASGLTLAEANAKEREFITKYRSNRNRYGTAFGYNQTDGGDGTKGLSRYGEANSFYGKQHSDSTRAKLSAANLGKFIGEKSARYGVTVTDEQRKQISNSLKNWYARNFSSSRKPVLCVSDGRIFNSAVEAAEYYGMTESEISACCLGRRKSSHDKQFSYSLDGKLPEYKSRAKNHNDLEWREKIARTKSIPVICVETGRIFDSAKTAAIEVGLVDGSGIGKCCKGKMEKAGGYHWKYVEVNQNE